MSKEILINFESIGDNCEFGLLQRKFGAEYSGLFRWSFSRETRDVIRILQTEFENLYRFENLFPRPGGDMVDDLPHGISYHSIMKSSLKGNIWTFKEDKEALTSLHAIETSKMKHLISNTVSALKAAKKVFVYKKSADTTEYEAKLLFEAIKSYNPRNRLLWVRSTNNPSLLGQVKEIEPGFFMGFIDRFASYDKASDFSEDAWMKIIHQVHQQCFSSSAGENLQIRRSPSIWQAKQDTFLWIGSTLNHGSQMLIMKGQTLLATWKAVYEPYFELEEVSLDNRTLEPQRYFIRFRDWVKE